MLNECFNPTRVRLKPFGPRVEIELGELQPHEGSSETLFLA